MARRPGILGQIWRNIKHTIVVARSKETLVGRDVNGNAFYERVADPTKGIKPLRRIESADGDTWNAPEVPVEWNAWLRFQRDTPPTEEEIQKNEMMKLRTQHRAKERGKIPREKTTLDEPMVQSGSQKTPFPVYDDYEIEPGVKTKR